MKIEVVLKFLIIYFTITIKSLPCVASESTIQLVQLASFYQALGDYFDVSILSEEQNFTDQFYTENRFFGPSVLFAIRSISFLDQFNGFCSRNRNAIIIQPANLTSFSDSMGRICNALKCSQSQSNSNLDYHMFWSPTIFFIWPNIIGSYEEITTEIIRLYFSACVQNGIRFLMDSEVYVLGFNTNAEINTLNIYELYSIQNLTVFDNMSQEFNQLTFETFQRKLTRRKNFRYEKLRAVAQEKASSFQAVEFRSIGDELTLYGGFNAEYFNTMAVLLNIRTIGVKGFEVISKKPNGTMGGIGKQLLDGDADVSIMHSEYLPYRKKHLSYLHPHYVDRLTAFFKQPAATSVRDIYIRSVKTDLRLAAVCTAIGILICLTIISIVQKFYNKNEISANDGSIGNALQWGIAAFCQQGSHIQPITISMKLAVFVSLLFSVIIYIGFSASVVSQLSVPVIPIKTFEDILRSDMDIYLDNITQSTHEYMDNAESLGIIKTKSRNERLINTTDAIQKMSIYGIAYISIGDEFYLTAKYFNYTEQFLCKTISKVPIDPIALPLVNGMTVPKNSPYLEYLKYAQLLMREFGVHQRLHNNYMRYSQPMCETIPQTEPPQLGINDTLTAFTFLFVFAIISFIFLIFEVLIKGAQISSRHLMN